MQNVIVYNVKNESEIEPVKQWYYRQYPPLGYDTRLDSVRKQNDGSFDLTFTRLTSCD